MPMELYLMSIPPLQNVKKKLGSKWEGFANAWRTTQLEYTWLRSLMKKTQKLLGNH